MGKELGYKIREARLDKVPYMIIVGENEKNNMSVSVRQRDAESDKQDMGEMSLEQVVNLVKSDFNRTFRFSKLGLLYYDDDNITPGTYFCYKVCDI